MAAVTDYRALISGSTWWQPDATNRSTILTYSFEAAPPAYFARANPGAVSSFAPLNETERGVVREALKAWSSVAGVTFIETSRHQGDMTFAFYNLDLLGSASAAGMAGYPSPMTDAAGKRLFGASDGALSAADVWFDTTYRASATFRSDFLHVALHEIGHALGLKHPFETEPNHSEILTPEADNGANTVMSYDQNIRALKLGPLDIAAAQVLYGPATSKNGGFASFSYDPVTERFEGQGSANAELLRGTGTDDRIVSNGGRDLILTAQGNDVVVGKGQPIEVNGGPGVDTVITGFSLGNLADLRGDASFRYMNVGADFSIFIDVERIAFTNNYIAYDVDGNAGQAYRLYQAAFARTPDKAGLSFWVDRLDDGASLNAIAAGFTGSAEFATAYGSSLTSAQYVAKFYQNVLGRAGEATGVAFWTGELNRGVSLANVLLGFSESPENHAAIDPKIVGGIQLDPGFFLVA